MGRFHRVLDPGLQILMPFLDRVKYVKSLKEVAIEIPSQSAITQGIIGPRKSGKMYWYVTSLRKTSVPVANRKECFSQ